jgi:3-hydroxy-D-aspartate aldolase
VRPPASIGQRLEEVDTPALILDLDAFERNLATLQKALAGKKVRVRAHAKTHKCPEIARRQIAAGAVGVCCQKVSEAEALVEGGVEDVLISNEIVGAQKLARLAELSRRARLGVCVDNAEHVLQLEKSGVTLDVYVELEVGMRRCGIAPGEPAVELAKSIARSSHLRFAGLQAYHGRAQHLRSMEERRSSIGAAAKAVRETKALLEKSGIACPLVTGAGSGTFMFEVESGAWDEIQPGSYVFMDADYARNEWAAPLPRFEHALFVLSTVMSRPAPQIAIVDAGLKAACVD